ncbi:hypothetical protein GGS24DRAFT_509145 [Hypoxylon argillaceum]|nr:hypothetical protein GGS24DRAFT_509145 [Hypoxylon argillaceum]
MPGLSGMPPELIHKICKYLVPDVVELGTPRLEQEQKERQNALRSLTLVSRYLGVNATEHLYHNLIITSCPQMVLLSRTLFHNEAVCHYPRYLANLVQLMDAGTQWRLEEEISRHFPDLPELLTSPPDLMVGRPLWTHEILQYIITILPNLKDILTSVFRHEATRWDNLGLNPDQAFFADDLSLPSLENSPPRTVRIQVGNEPYFPSNIVGIDLIPDGIPLFQLYMSPLFWQGSVLTDIRFLNLANVTEYEVHGAWGHCFDLSLGADWPTMPNNGRILAWLAGLKKLTLSHSNLHGEDVGRLLSCCPNLKKFTWGSQGDDMNVECEVASDIESALQNAASHLEEISLPRSCVHGVVSFRNFRALRVLSVSLNVITDYCSTPWYNKYTKTEDLWTSILDKNSLASLLPDTLNQLTLNCPLFDCEVRRCDSVRFPIEGHADVFVEQSDSLYPVWLADGLSLFASDCSSYLRHFKKLTVLQSHPRYGPNTKYYVVAIKDLGEEFHNAGVRLITKTPYVI